MQLGEAVLLHIADRGPSGGRESACAPAELINFLNDSVKPGRENMTVANMLVFALVAGLSFATMTSQASAAARDAEAGRDAAMERCVAEAKSHYPGKYYDYGQARNFAYEHCMYDAGQAP
jgi:hypothetical protein